MSSTITALVDAIRDALPPAHERPTKPGHNSRVAVLGALAIVAALVGASMSAGARRIVLLIGALPFAMVAWWGLAAPLSGFAISPSGMLTIRGDARRIPMAT